MATNYRNHLSVYKYQTSMLYTWNIKLYIILQLKKDMYPPLYYHTIQNSFPALKMLDGYQDFLKHPGDPKVQPGLASHSRSQKKTVMYIKSWERLLLEE